MEFLPPAQSIVETPWQAHDAARGIGIDIDVLSEEMIAARVRIFVGGLRAATSAKSVRVQSGGKVLVTNGHNWRPRSTPAFFWVLEAADMDEALGWGRKAAFACRAPVEVRPFY